jgi:hypothetical protein
VAREGRFVEHGRDALSDHLGEQGDPDARPGQDPDAVVDPMGQRSRQPELRGPPEAGLLGRPERDRDLPALIGHSGRPSLRNDGSRLGQADRDSRGRPGQQGVDVLQRVADHGGQVDPGSLGGL